MKLLIIWFKYVVNILDWGQLPQLCPTCVRQLPKPEIFRRVLNIVPGVWMVML